jgi:O-antigen/teichoic acid export membrane protein
MEQVANTTISNLVSPPEPDRSTLRNRMLRGSAILLFSTGLVSATNLLYNIAIARGLGAAGFGHATAIYTLLMLLSAVTLAYQLVCSKLVAKSETMDGKVAIYKDLLRRSWQTGLLVGVAIALGSGVIAEYLRLPSARDIVLLGFGTAIYVPLGVRRGMLLGIYDFSRIAINFVIEAVVKIVGALVLLHYGFGVSGVIGAVVASIAVAYVCAVPAVPLITSAHLLVRASFREGMQAIVFFCGQVIISNLDILFVKHYFAADVAGQYAAIALVGRVVYMFSWSVISSMFPVSAASTKRTTSRAVLKTALVVVACMTTMFTLVAWIAPTSLWRSVLGSHFLSTSHVAFSSLLGAYSAMTSVYSLAVVLLAYEMSRKIANATWVQLLFSALLPAGIALFHSSLQQVIMVQLVLMLGLLLAVSLPFIPEILSEEAETTVSADLPGFSKLRRVREPEVIAEFLRAEFYQPEFDRYREEFSSVVASANLEDERENAIRKALLFRRRGRLWRELPADTQWWEIQLQPGDLPRVRAFPRKQWRKFAEGDFYLTRMVARIRTTVESKQPSWFSEKVRSVAADLQDRRVPNSVLLIGVDEHGPLTIIEGNHRMAAAMLVAPENVSEQFRFYCGLSPKMTRCCWYQTDVRSLTRYATNIVRYLFHDQDFFVRRQLRNRAAQTAAE